MTRRSALAALLLGLTAPGLGAGLGQGRALADTRVTVPFGSTRRVSGLDLHLPEPSFDHFDDGSFDAWTELEARAAGRSERVVLSIHDHMPRPITLLGRSLRVVAWTDAGVTVAA